MRTNRTNLVLIVAVAVTLIVLVQAPGRVGDQAHPPEAAALQQPPSNRDVLVIGDSLTVDSSTVIADALPDRNIDVVAFGGLQAAQSVEYLSFTDLTGVDTVVIALGTNDWWFGQDNDFASTVQSMIDAARGRRIIWVNIDLGSGLAGAAGHNQVLADAAARHPNVEVADWNRYVNSIGNHQNLRIYDGIHYTTEGSRIRGMWVAGLLATA